MSIVIHLPEQQAKIRKAGIIVKAVMDSLKQFNFVGKTTLDVNNYCHDLIVNVHKAIPVLLNYNGFPKTITVGVNEEVCHAIPSNRKLIEGDIIGVHISIKFDGFCSSANRTFLVGQVSDEVKKIVDVTEKCLEVAIEKIRPGARLGDIGYSIQKKAEGAGYSVVREYCGFGIGESLHQEPQVLNYGPKNSGVELKAGMSLVVIPMINMGKRHVKLLKKDGWTVKTVDQKVSASIADTILITEQGCEVVTR